MAVGFLLLDFDKGGLDLRVVRSDREGFSEVAGRGLEQQKSVTMTGELRVDGNRTGCIPHDDQRQRAQQLLLPGEQRVLHRRDAPCLSTHRCSWWGWGVRNDTGEKRGGEGQSRDRRRKRYNGKQPSRRAEEKKKEGSLERLERLRVGGE